MRFWGACVIVATLLLGGMVLVVRTSTVVASPFFHVLYLPVILSGLFFGVRGGVVCGLLAGVVPGPAAAGGEAVVWLARLGGLVVAGGLAGAAATLIGRRVDAARGEIEELSDACLEALRVYASTVAVRDGQADGYCERVGENARVVGRALGLSERACAELYWAGVLHDCGKVAVAERILRKRGPLTAEEYARARRHAAVGADLIRGVSPRFHRIAAAIRTHHERWDGTGYPDGLSGGMIPLFGRILAVVDAFEALTSDRPYRDAHPADVAMEHLRVRSGTAFDPDVVEAFEALFRRGRIRVDGLPERGWRPASPVPTNIGALIRGAGVPA